MADQTAKMLILNRAVAISYALRVVIVYGNSIHNVANKFENVLVLDHDIFKILKEYQ